jgi:hypothetical protein
MKGIIHGMGALMTWSLGPLSLVRESKFSWLVIILVQEAILVVIPTGGHLGYYRSIRGQNSYFIIEGP